MGLNTSVVSSVRVVSLEEADDDDDDDDEREPGASWADYSTAGVWAIVPPGPFEKSDRTAGVSRLLAAAVVHA
ncbi:hypothetical protein E4U41_000410 [Claviceps citrina]|nr:hypothetical protein E4U41_000410 [Claviceps citrina]